MGFFTELKAMAAGWGIEFGPRSPTEITVSKVRDLHNVRHLLAEGETIVVEWDSPWIRSRGQIYLEGVADALDLAKHQAVTRVDGKQIDVYGDGSMIRQWCVDRSYAESP